MFWLLNYVFARPVQIEEYQKWQEFLRNFSLFSLFELALLLVATLGCFIFFSWAFKVNTPKAVFQLKWLWWMAWILVGLVLQPLISFIYASMSFESLTGGQANLIALSLTFWSIVIVPAMLILAFWICTLFLVHPDKVRYTIPFRNIFFKG